MAEYTATIVWKRKAEERFIDEHYSRAHVWRFDGGAEIAASSAPAIVPPPYSVESHVDPEEAFVASLSSCHMLLFLAIAAKKKYVVDEYNDHAIGRMETDSEGRLSITTVTLRPKVAFQGTHRPSEDELEKIHHLSHKQCFIANSVKTNVITEIVRD